jgi:hypothetical protein
VYELPVHRPPLIPIVAAGAWKLLSTTEQVASPSN